MIKKFLFIGYGNMTKKYCKILEKYKKKISIKFYTNQKIKNNLSKNIIELKKYNPDIIFICSSTVDHYKHLKLINGLFKNKIIIVEKPLFHKLLNLRNLRNKIFVDFNLRYDPLIQYIKDKTNKKKFLTVEIFCKSYLPYWRKNDYSKSYSSKRKLGGGVLLDLSHEIDYLLWMFGEIKIDYVINNKISDLKIDSDDNLLLIGKSKKVKQIFLHLNYYSKLEHRSISVSSKKVNFYADLINKKIIFSKKNRSLKIKSWKEKGFKITFERLIKDIIYDKEIKLPDFKFSLKVQKIISRIQKK